MASFQPPWWLRNCHLQSCLGLVHAPKYQQSVTWEQLDLPDGDFVDLCWAGRLGRPIVVLLHGLEGSIESHYIQLMMHTLTQQGFQVVVMHFRCCSGRINRKARSYHACETGDFEFLLQTLHERYPQQPIQAVGFSLGANVLLHHLAKSHDSSPLRSGVAVSTPFELDKSAEYIPKFYKWGLLRSMKYKTIQKILLGQDIPATIEQVKRIGDFRTFDNVLTAPLNGFKNADDYYQCSSIRPMLKNIEHPTLMIHAKDDPFVPLNSIPKSEEFSSSISFDLQNCGGHVGFAQGETPWRISRWFQNRILAFLENSL